MSEREYACVMCPHLPVTGVGLVRHVATAHFKSSVEDINTAFAGVKVFAKCPHCPERFLATGIMGHITRKHKDIGVPRGTPVHSAVIRSLTTPTPPTTQARQECQQARWESQQARWESQTIHPDQVRTGTVTSDASRAAERAPTTGREGIRDGPSHGVPRVSIGNPAVTRSLKSPTLPPTQARRESQTTTSGPVRTDTAPGGTPATRARTATRSSPDRDDLDRECCTLFVGYDAPPSAVRTESEPKIDANGKYLGPGGKPLRNSRFAAAQAREVERERQQEIDAATKRVKSTPSRPVPVRREVGERAATRAVVRGDAQAAASHSASSTSSGTSGYVRDCDRDVWERTASPAVARGSVPAMASRPELLPETSTGATASVHDDHLVHASPWEFGSTGEEHEEEEEEAADPAVHVRPVDVEGAIDPGVHAVPAVDEVEAEAEVEAEVEGEAEDEGAVDPIAIAEGLGAVQPDVIDDYGTLVGHFHRGAYYKHHSWKGPIKTIVLSLLHDCVSEEEEIASCGIAALQLLPGLVSHCKGLRGKKVWNPIQFLRAVEGAPNKAEEIVRIARSWVPTLRALPSIWPTPSIENLRARVESLTAESRLSAAATTLKSMDELLRGVNQQPQPSPEYLAERIAALHPLDDDRDDLPDAHYDPPVERCLQLTADQVRQRFYGISKKNTASGNTGWSNEWLRFLGDDRNEPNYVHTETLPNALHVAFTLFFNKILQGRIVGEGRSLIVTARLIMIPKPQGGLRPIRIECAMIRLMSATAAAIARAVLAPTLRPLQLGGGLKGGVEIGARLLDAAYARDDCIISVDIANAFNSTRHRRIWDSLRANYPEILRYYRMKYETPSKMIGNDGKIIAWSRTGVGQGDPWAGLFFEVAVHSALHELQQKVEQAERSYNFRHPREPVVRPGAVSAYEDDTQIRGETAIMFMVAPCIEGIFNNYGFAVNVSKSKITGKWAEGLYEAPDGFQVIRDGIVALGVPIGTHGYRRDKIADSIQEMEPPLAALKLLRPRTAVQLLLGCINSRPAFLLRTAADIDIVSAAASAFDSKMVQAVADVFHLEVTSEFRDRLYLPLRMGGFGLTRHYGMATEKNQLLSRTIFSAYLSQYYPDEFQATQQTYYMSVVRLGAIEEIGDATELTQGVMDTLTVKNCGAILGDGMRKAQKAIFARVYKEAVDGGFLSKAAWLLSAATSTTAYLLSGTAMEHDGYFDPAEFRCAGRNTLGYGPVDAQPGQMRKCGGCNREYTLLSEPFHGMSCSGTRGYRTRRHNEIRDLLFKLIKKRYPLLTNEFLKLEDYVGSIRDGTQVRADITWVLEAEKVVVDLVCIDVGCSLYIKAPTRSFLSSERAALHAEKGKRDHYARVVEPARLNANSIIPFVIEASGRLGPAALGFVNRICGTQTFIKSSFLREISMITAKFRGRMLRASRDQYHDAYY